MTNEEKATSISAARSLEEIADFWDTHSLADFEEQTYEVEMEFDPSARLTHVNIEPELLEELRAQALKRRVSTQTLINLWLRQRLDEINTQSDS